MITDQMKLAAALASGEMKLNWDTPCKCGKPLRDPVAMNPTSRIDNEVICTACRDWEMSMGCKYPAEGDE